MQAQNSNANVAYVQQGQPVAPGFNYVPQPSVAAHGSKHIHILIFTL